MTPFCLVDDEIVVPDGTHQGIKGRIQRSLKFAPDLSCGVQLEPISSSYLPMLRWLREKDLPGILVEDFDTMFFANEADRTFFLLIWANHQTA